MDRVEMFRTPHGEKVMNRTPAQNLTYAELTAGDPAPWFHQRSTSNVNYAFDTAAGRYIVLGFYVTAGDTIGRASLQSIMAHRHYFDDVRFSFFGVSLDPHDEAQKRVAEALPGIRFFWDSNGLVSRLYGSMPTDHPGSTTTVRRFWIVLDPTLRVLRVIPFASDGSDTVRLFAYLEQLPPPGLFAGAEVPAPILLLPNVFEEAFCGQLIDLYRIHGGEESGFMGEVDGKTVELQDRTHKQRRDYVVQDPDMIRRVQGRIVRRVFPEVLKIYSFKATRLERYLVACYSAEYGGHFRAHRDNTTKGTAHRRFAVSVNLNADFEGGELTFPEYGSRSYKPPVGGALVFPCRLLHAVSHVTRGQRFAFLPFVYDEEAAKIRAANNTFLGEGVEAYQSD